MTINLKPEQERIIREEIENGHFHSADEVIDHALAALKEKGRKRVGGPNKNLAQFFDGVSFCRRGIEFGAAEGLPSTHEAVTKSLIDTNVLSEFNRRDPE